MSFDTRESHMLWGRSLMSLLSNLWPPLNPVFVIVKNILYPKKETWFQYHICKMFLVIHFYRKWSYLLPFLFFLSLHFILYQTIKFINPSLSLSLSLPYPTKHNGCQTVHSGHIQRIKNHNVHRRIQRIKNHSEPGLRFYFQKPKQ